MSSDSPRAVNHVILIDDVISGARARNSSISLRVMPAMASASTPLRLALVAASLIAAVANDPRCRRDWSPRRPARERSMGRFTGSSDDAGGAHRPRPPTPDELYPNKIPCPMASRVIGAPNVHELGDVVVPLCSGFESPWNNYVTVSLPKHVAPERGPHSVLSIVDTGDSDVMIMPWWGNTTDADLRGTGGAYRVSSPYKLVCPHPVSDSFGVRSLLLKGPATVGSDLEFVSEFFQNLDSQGPDNVGNFGPGNAYTHGFGVGKPPIWYARPLLALDLT